MRLLRGFEAVESVRGGYASIGNFDGVHRGHQAMLNALTSRSRSDGVSAVAVTFDPHPIALLRPEATPPPLTSIEYRAELLGRYGVDVTIVIPTDRQLLALTAEEFFDRIVRGELHAKGLVEGPNFFFGRNRSGNVTVLRSLCAAHGLEFDVVPPVTVDEQLVSSSVIRSLIEAGDIGHAVRLLGHPYRISGVVGRGAERGRTLGFPTANLFDVPTLTPANGVYGALASTTEGRRAAAVNVGPNPTFGESARKIEVHILDFNDDLYGQTLQVDFLDRVRDVRRFATVEELRTQLEQDLVVVRAQTAAML
ncbi:MAG: bifunctional riboflavin kinase/FAD synthetase [Candidatus Saccharimonas sp.]|nr:bifunctional riboflavin kinase/FAD synthetase [Planctomycetaceae bacterium]